MRLINRFWRTIKRNWISILVWVLIIVGWEVAGHLAPKSHLTNSPLVPSWEFTVTSAFKSLSGSWTMPFLAPNPALGGEETYLGAVAALVYNSLTTLLRLLLGLFVGVLAGVVSGFMVSYWPLARRAAWAPMNYLRMLPLLAAIPLFQFWLGANMVGTTVFIAFGVWVLMVVWTITAVGNVESKFIESAETLGASRLRAYVTVVMPAALPQLRTGMVLATGLSWSLAVGAEYLGVPNGLGSVMATAESFSNTGRMLIVAVVVAVYAIVTAGAVQVCLSRLLRWVPTSEVLEEQPVGAVGLAGVPQDV